MEKLRHFTAAIPNINKNILGIGGVQPPYIRTESFGKIIEENEKLLLELVECKNGKVIFLTASGTGGMDSAVSNLVSPENKVLIVNGGPFGQRWCDICSFYKINYKSYNLKPGEKINLKSLEDDIKSFSADILLMQATETSSGQLFNVKEVGKLTKKYGALLIVDAISSFAIDQYKMDSWGVDVTILSTQKGLQLFPGFSMIILNEKALKIKFFLRNYYMDYNKYLSRDRESFGVLPFTPNITVLLQLNYRLKEIKEKGLKELIDKANKRAINFRKMIKDLPLKIVAEQPSNCVTTMETGKNDVKKFFKDLQTKNIYITPWSDSGFNICHIGELDFEDDKILYEEIKKWLIKK